MTTPTTRIVNLTAHPVTVYEANGVLARWEPCGVVARVIESIRESAPLASDHGDVPVCLVRYEERIEGLPATDADAGTAYVVSRVLAAARPRHDLYFPVDEVLDEHGRIIGCRALGQFAQEGEILDA